jgi:hypothetical protein
VPVRRRLNWPLLGISFGIAVGLLLIVLGLASATSQRDRVNLPDELESVAPGNGDRVLRQSRIVVDLVTGYEGVLIVDGIELPVARLDELSGVGGAQPAPGEQVILPPVAVYDPGNATLSFQPTPGSIIEEFTQGEHRVTVLFWKITEGRQAARQYSWSFSVT